MKKNTNRDYWEDDSDRPDNEEIPMSAFELSEMIEQRIVEKGEKSSYWKKEVNSLIDEYNERFGHTYERR